MKVTIKIETEVISPLTHYEGLITIANGSRQRDYYYKYLNPFPSIKKDTELPINTLEIKGEMEIPDSVFLELQRKIYLNITSESSAKKDNKILSEEEEKNLKLYQLLGWTLV